jgi:adenylosuccinate lyase
LCCAVTRASALCIELLADLEVHVDRMRANVNDRGGVAMSEHAVRLLEPHVGLPNAYAAVRRAALATEAGRFAHITDALAEAAAGYPASLNLEQLRDPGTAVASAVALAQAWSRARVPAEDGIG